MDRTSTGWVVFIGAMGMMCTLMATDLGKLTSWQDAASVSFVAMQLAHLGVVAAAFVAGKIIPETRTSQHTRSTDPQTDLNPKGQP